MTESATETGADNGSETADVAEPNTEADPGQSDLSESERPDSEQSADAVGDFPAIDVSNVMTGQTLNLQQELSGGDTPILLWFYAPH